MLLAEIMVTYAGPPSRPSDAWRLVDAGSPFPRVGRHRTAASVPRTGSPGTHPQDGCGAASRVGSGDLGLSSNEYVIELVSVSTYGQEGIRQSP